MEKNVYITKPEGEESLIPKGPNSIETIFNWFCEKLKPAFLFDKKKTIPTTTELKPKLTFEEWINKIKIQKYKYTLGTKI